MQPVCALDSRLRGNDTESAVRLGWRRRPHCHVSRGRNRHLASGGLRGLGAGGLTYGVDGILSLQEGRQGALVEGPGYGGAVWHTR
jgi:hypothetical protein